jgi:hypothetical protein
MIKDMKRQLLSMLICSAALCAHAQNSVSVDITSRVLVNPDFEMPFTDNSVAPQGWAEYPENTSVVRTVDNSANNLSGSQLCMYKPTDGGQFEAPFKLYQAIPAARLGAGIYKVSCLMWIEKDFYGTACLFADDAVDVGANTQVQYWAGEEYYNNSTSNYNVLTPTDVSNTFACYAGGNSTNIIMRPMTVYITLTQNEDLVVGIRTSSANQGVAKSGAGYFKVDNFRVEKVVALPQKDVNTFSSEVLVNNDFELDPTGTTYVTKKDAWNGEMGKDIYGWTKTQETDNYGAVSKCTNLAGKWAVWFSSKSTEYRMQNDFRFYQSIPAEKLEPGVYEITSRMWQQTGHFGMARLYANNGNKTVAQYYGTKDDYYDMEPTDEEASYAGYIGTGTSGSSRRVDEMYISIPVQSGQGLELGVKSGYGDESNNNTDYGNFFLDFVRLHRVSGLPLTLKTDAANDIPEATYARQLTINRQLTNNQWSSLCLPFALTSADIATLFGEGAQVALFSEADKATNTMKFTLAEAVPAGEPFLVKPTDALASPLLLDDVVISDNLPKTDVSNTDYSFKGVYSPATLSATGHYYQVAADGNTLTPVTQVSAIDAYIEAPANTTITIVGKETGIQLPTEVTSKKAPVYTIDGRQAGATLHKGIYVCNGHKFIVK